MTQPILTAAQIAALHWAVFKAFDKAHGPAGIEVALAAFDAYNHLRVQLGYNPLQASVMRGALVEQSQYLAALRGKVAR